MDFDYLGEHEQAAFPLWAPVSFSGKQGDILDDLPYLNGYSLSMSCDSVFDRGDSGERSGEGYVSLCLVYFHSSNFNSVGVRQVIYISQVK